MGLQSEFDDFVPLIDSGIYIAVWVNPKFLSTIIYTCGEFDAEKAIGFMREFFQLSDFQAAIFQRSEIAREDAPDNRRHSPIRPARGSFRVLSKKLYVETF